MKPGDYIVWYNRDHEPVLKRECRSVVVTTAWYASLEEYLAQEGLVSTLPSITELQDALALYRTHYEEEDIAKNGIVALKVKVVVHYVHCDFSYSATLRRWARASLDTALLRRLSRDGMTLHAW